MKNIVKSHLENLIKVLLSTIDDTSLIDKIAKKIIITIKNNKKIFVYGNGGSFADSSHFVGELTATYEKKRKPLPFILLGSNMASVSAWVNDFKNDEYISRELIAYGQKGDILMILSSSGGNIKKKQSTNLIKLSKVAKQKKIFQISLLGKGGGVLKNNCDISYIVESNKTATIQEVQKSILHSICAIIDAYIK